MKARNRCAQTQKGCCIALPPLPGKATDHRLITGSLHIPAQEEVGHPHERMEPIDGQQHKAQHLPPGITPADMRPFMRQNMDGISAFHVKGQIDGGMNQSQNKGRFHIFALLDALLQPHRCGHPAPQAQGGEKRIAQHSHHTEEPNPRQHPSQHLSRVDALPRCSSQGIGEDGIYHPIDHRHAAVDLRLGGGKHGLRQRLDAGNEAQWAFNGHRTQKPKPHQPPHGAEHGLGRPAQQQPQRQHRQHQPPGGDAPIDKAQKYSFHV